MRDDVKAVREKVTELAVAAGLPADRLDNYLKVGTVVDRYAGGQRRIPALGECRRGRRLHWMPLFFATKDGGLAGCLDVIQNVVKRVVDTYEKDVQQAAEDLAARNVCSYVTGGFKADNLTVLVTDEANTRLTVEFEHLTEDQARKLVDLAADLGALKHWRRE